MAAAPVPLSLRNLHPGSFALVMASGILSIGLLLGMYAVASARLGLAAEFAPLHWISQLMIWVALSAWGLVLAGLLRSRLLV